MKWFKYKQSQASGTDYEWTFIALPDDPDIDITFVEEWLDYHNILDNWSELYRGVTIKRVYKVSKKVLEQEIEKRKRELYHKKTQLKELDEELKELMKSRKN